MDGSEFDFLHGSWSVANRKLTRMTDPECDEWTEFSSSWECEAMLGGSGNIDHIHMHDSGHEGFTLRLFDPGADLWRIWWASTVVPGRLDPPVQGRFAPGGVGRFEGPDEICGIPIVVRFEWSDTSATTARWAQAFSFDRGATWKPNWVMELSR